MPSKRASVALVALGFALGMILFYARGNTEFPQTSPSPAPLSSVSPSQTHAQNDRKAIALQREINQLLREFKSSPDLEEGRELLGAILERMAVLVDLYPKGSDERVFLQSQRIRLLMSQVSVEEGDARMRAQDEALRLARQNAAEYPKDAEAHWLLGSALESAHPDDQADDQEAALAEFKECLRLDPHQDECRESIKRAGQAARSAPAGKRPAK